MLCFVVIILSFINSSRMCHSTGVDDAVTLKELHKIGFISNHDKTQQWVNLLQCNGSEWYSMTLGSCQPVLVPVWSMTQCSRTKGPYNTGDPLHSRAPAHSRAPLLTQPCPHCSHSRAPGEQCARLCVFTLQGCVQAVRLCRRSPVI